MTEGSQIINQESTRLILYPGNVRYECTKWGAMPKMIHRMQPLPWGIYCNGKNWPTLTHVTNQVPVKVREARGCGSGQIVGTTDVKENRNSVNYILMARKNFDP